MKKIIILNRSYFLRKNLQFLFFLSSHNFKYFKVFKKINLILQKNI